MKIIGNLDATGNIKLRGKVIDRLVVEGGFYSGQFGEMAYKSDVVPQGSGSVVDNFYGIIVRQTNYPIGPAFGGINTINFNTNHFYLSQNDPNTDEVVVNLRELRDRRLHYSEEATVPVSTVDGGGGAGVTELTLMQFTVPANTMNYNNALKGLLGYIRDTTDNTSIEFKWYVNDVPFIQYGVAAGGSDFRPEFQNFFFNLQRDVPGKATFVNTTNGSANSPTSTVITIGHGTLGAFNGLNGQFGRFLFDFDPTITNVFKLTVRRENTIDGDLLRRFGSVELLQ